MTTAKIFAASILRFLTKYSGAKIKAEVTKPKKTHRR